MKKYLDFEELTNFLKKKTKTFAISSISTGDFLGVVKWNNGWRQYCFYPDSDTHWSNGCLQEVKDFIGKLMCARLKDHDAVHAKSEGDKNE